MSSIICARITPKPSTTSSTKKVKSVSQSPTKIPTPGALDTGVMKTARFAEAVNGRAAMQGVLWGSLDWMMSGENIIQQLEGSYVYGCCHWCCYYTCCGFTHHRQGLW